MSGQGTSLSLLTGTRTRVSSPGAVLLDCFENKVEQTSLLASLVNEEPPGL